MYGTNGTFNPVTNYIEYVTRVKDFLNYIKSDLGLNNVGEILTTVRTKQLFNPLSTFCDEQIA